MTIFDGLDFCEVNRGNGFFSVHAARFSLVIFTACSLLIRSKTVGFTVA